MDDEKAKIYLRKNLYLSESELNKLEIFKFTKYIQISEKK